MFSSLFLSKNQKSVKKWTQEHAKIVSLATDIIEQYAQNNIDKVRKNLKQLHTVAVAHLMDEDIKLFELLNESSSLDDDIEKLATEFRSSFRGIKVALINFLKKYSRDDSPIDDQFIDAFKELVGVLGERIAFEEENLYSKLDTR